MPFYHSAIIKLIRRIIDRRVRLPSMASATVLASKYRHQTVKTYESKAKHIKPIVIKKNIEGTTSTVLIHSSRQLGELIISLPV